jgi:hypothetical protein
MGGAGHAARTGKKIHAYMDLLLTAEGKRVLGIPKGRCKDNI